MGTLRYVNSFRLKGMLKDDLTFLLWLAAKPSAIESRGNGRRERAR